jgi:hypothetical protein
MTHDYKRNGTATLLAALNAGRQGDPPVPGTTPASRMATLSSLTGRCHTRPQTTAPDRGQLRHPQTSQSSALAEAASALPDSLHPTSASWLNMVERFFRDLTVKRLRRGVFRDVMELVEAIDSYVDQHN